MLKVLMYSYKGGAGRTVSTANIAALLATEFKKRVVCIDLDIESAGLGVVFDLDPGPVRGQRSRCIQDVLKRSAFGNYEEFLEWWPTLARPVIPAAAGSPSLLECIPARPAHHESVDWDNVHANPSMPLDNLLTHLEAGDHPPDFVLIDSASGLADPAAIGLSLADCVVAFLRWNRQFLQGTIDIVKFLLGKSEIEFSAGRGTGPVGVESIMQIVLVPTAEPEIAESEQGFRAILETSRSRLAAELEIGSEPRVRLLEAIPESRRLKWEERLLPLEDRKTMSREDVRTLDGYRRVAQHLIKLEAEFGN